MLIETRGNALISDLAKYLRDLPATERRSELDLITAYVETVEKFQSNQSVDAFDVTLLSVPRDRSRIQISGLFACSSSNVSATCWPSFESRGER